MYPVKAIPDKLFFKIGEVCELIEVQPHVLRYWESEFPSLAPQKNRAGQRTYRRKDVEMVVRIKQLLYDEGFTIAGAKKKISLESRGTAKLKVVTPDMVAEPRVIEARPTLKEVPLKEVALAKEVGLPSINANGSTNIAANSITSMTIKAVSGLTGEQRQVLWGLKQELQALLTRLSSDVIMHVD